MEDALRQLLTERDENTCRKDFTPEEAVVVGREIEKLERPKAKARQKEHGRTAPGKSRNTSENFSEVKSSGRTLDKAADAVGMSRITYQRAAAVADAAEDNPDLVPLVEEMDRTGKVNGVFVPADINHLPRIPYVLVTSAARPSEAPVPLHP